MAAHGDVRRNSGRLTLQERFGKILHVSTLRCDAVGVPQWKRSSSSQGLESVKKIRVVPDFSELYELGKAVMPSGHKYMKVLIGIRKRDGHECVVKVRYKPNCFTSKKDERNWRRNTEFMMNMPDNCGVVEIYEVLEDSKAFYIVMEKVTGMDLFETLEQEGRFSPAKTREIVRQLLSAMAHMHSNNAVHKDLKLENVMLSRELSPGSTPGSTRCVTPSSVKVIDFDTIEEWTPTSPKSTHVLGTDQYIAQEAYAGKYSPCSDVFAIGVIAYRMLSGRFPFHDNLFDDEAGENWVGCPKMAQIQRRLQIAKVDFDHAVFRESPQAADLVARMLAVDELHRPSATVALEHPWFQEATTPPKVAARRASESGPLRKTGSFSAAMERAAHAEQKFVAPTAIAWGQGSTQSAPLVSWGVRASNEDFLDDGSVIADEAVPLIDNRRQALCR